MMFSTRKALIVGIDSYLSHPLRGCINDANAIAELLTKNEDGSPNFQCRKLTAPPSTITRAKLKESVEELFSQPADIALLYFAGHGMMTPRGGYLVTSDAAQYDEGISMQDVLTLAHHAKTHEVVIILDCCDSGAFGSDPLLDRNNSYTLLREGITVLTASRAGQSSREIAGRGIFTALICNALSGGAADITGNVTVASVYAFVDQLLGAWDQRPLFQSFASKLSSLRVCKPDVELPVLRLLPLYFPSSSYEYPLDPSYEVDKTTLAPRDAEKEKIFRHFQAYRDARLLIPIGERHLYYAAIHSKSCKLTPLGRFYWQLLKDGRM